jgi:hypothetical protein
MMHPLDALVLARTKLRTHRVRTGITVVAAGLLFGLIIAALFFVQGIFTSVDKYSGVGLNNRVLLTIGHFPQSMAFDAYNHLNDEAFINEVETIHKEEVARKTAAAKKYSVPYDAALEDPSPVVINPITKQKTITVESLGSNAVQRATNARSEAAYTPFSIDEYLKPYRSAVQRGTIEWVQPTNGSFTYMKDGKENQKVADTPQEDYMMRTGSGASLTVLDGSVTKPFITNTAFDASKGEVPVILPFSDAEKLLGLSKLSKDASPNERKERLRYVREHVGTVTAAFCYRSEASRELMSQAVSQQDLIKRMAGDPTFVTPSLLYNEPNISDCSGVTIKSDTRSAAEKQAEANRVLFEKEINTWIGEPIQQKIVVRGVGISGDNDTASSTLSLGTLVRSLLNSTLGYETWVVPQDVLAQLPAASRPDVVFGTRKEGIFDAYGGFQSTSYLVEFGDKDEARSLLTRTGAFTGSVGDVSAYPFGSGVLFIDDLRTWTEKILFWALLAVGAIAAVTLWAVIGRTIADSRRESAVFRAIGATRLDVASIYSLYAFLLSLRVAIFALVLGLSVSLLVDILYSESATTAAQLAYAAADTDIRFHLMNIFSQYVPIVLGVIVLVGLVASIVPILLGVRRNPINDMRDEN